MRKVSPIKRLVFETKLLERSLINIKKKKEDRELILKELLL